MNEYETPQRPPAAGAGAEQPPHPSELPPAEPGQLDSAAAPTPPGADPDPDRPVTGPPTGPYPLAPAAGSGPSGSPPYPTGSPYAPGQPYAGGQPHAPGQPHGSGQPYAAGFPTGPGQPGQYPAPGGYAGTPPLWHQPMNAPPPRRPNRVGQVVAGAAVALVLMAGSGVAGGAVALALTDSNPTSAGRTFNAAPIISSADLPGIAAAVENSVVSVTTGSGEGSGVVLSADGFVLTNNHVVAGADTVRVVFADGTSASAEITGTDPKTDLAVLKAEGVSDLEPAKFGDSDAIRVGDTVLALGSPLGLQGSVTAGIISSLNRTIQAGSQNDPGQGVSSIAGLLQTDAPINPGNSGGALVNTNGEVIGINTAIATAGQSNGNIGVGFAIPSNKAKAVTDALRRGEKVSHPFLGVSVTAADGGGAIVGTVTPGSPADQAGLQQGDVVTRFGDKPINDSIDLVSAVQAGKVGDRVELTYTRNGVENTATVTLAETS